MTEIIEIIVQYVSIWAPSLVAILGVVATVIGAINKSKAALEEFKKSDTLKDLASELKTSISENQELRYQNSLLLDEITKIKDYVKHKKEE
jgi:gas vesicle protein